VVHSIGQFSLAISNMIVGIALGLLSAGLGAAPA
jgi:hypothetical protein